MQSLLGFVSRCCFFLSKVATHYEKSIEPLIWGICVSFFGRHFFHCSNIFGEYPRLGNIQYSLVNKILGNIQDWFHYFCSLFQSAFPFEFGAVSPEQSNQIPLQVVLREEKKQMRSAEDATGG